MKLVRTGMAMAEIAGSEPTRFVDVALSEGREASLISQKPCSRSEEDLGRLWNRAVAPS
jgi:hypothetical protein